MVRGLEKNTFPGMSHFKFWRAAAFMIAWVFVLAGVPAGVLLFFPGLALAGGDALGAAPWLSWLGIGCAATIALQLVAALVISRIHHRPLGALLLHGVGQWLLLYILLRSTWRYYRERGVSWRETRYELDELRAHQRVKV